MKYIHRATGVFILLISMTLDVTTVYAQTVAAPPEITEYEVFLNTNDINNHIAQNLSACGLGVSVNDSTNVKYMPNPSIQWSAPDKVVIRADRFIDSVASTEVYENFSLSGTVRVNKGGIVFTLTSYTPKNIPSCNPTSMARSINESLTYLITPSPYNTYEEKPENLKCGAIEGGRLRLVYDTKGANNYVPYPYALCKGTEGASGENDGTYEISVGDPSEVLRVPIDNPIPSVTSLDEFVKRLMSLVITISIPITALAIIYSGFMIVTARGDEQKLRRGKQAFVAAVIGGMFILGAWVLADIMGNAIDNMRT